MRNSRRFQPSLFDFVFVLWVTLIPIALGGRLLSSDGDLARHLRLGEWMIAHGSALRVDNFSYTMGGRPFLPFEWGSEVLYAAAHRIGGLAGVAVLAGVLLALTYALLVRFLLHRGIEPLIAYLTAMAAAILGASHWVARPHLFTLPLVVVLLELLERADRRSLWWFLPLFSLWANLHGGFVYGLVLICLYLCGDLVEVKLRPGEMAWRARVERHGLALLLAVVGICFNLNGFRLLTHLVDFFGKSVLMDKTHEFHSPDFHLLNGQLFLVALVGIILGFALSKRRPQAPHLLVIVATTASALQYQRNIELFALTALPLFVWHIDAEWRRLPWLGRLRKAFGQEQVATHRGLPSAIFAGEMMVLASLHGRIGTTQIVPRLFDPNTFPISAIERARAAGLEGRLFTEFTWGGYVLYAWPEQRVFIDGGTDHYGGDLLLEYLRVWALEPGWDRVLQTYHVNLMILPVNSSLAYELLNRREWEPWYCDQTAVILVRRDSPKAHQPAEASAHCDRAIPAEER